ncbi:hypothetical protein [Sporofaciens sp. SGI.106]|uniref:hypothetical protein n=1 Tax=Sporofaciens sp. SGI.106 TaxID=3420568 RepID=UPI002A9DC9DC|nr:hypothetical protein [Lachnoclostridium sp.]
MKRNLNAQAVLETDRPISEKKLSGIGDFLGLYGGEHIAATEFVFGATMVTWGCSAKMILLGLFIGNILATLSFTFTCAVMATRTRLTLYSYLKKILGPYAQKFYTVVWALASTLLAASGISVSGSALKEIVGIGVQQEWYPTSLGFIAIVVILGVVVTFVAANGFQACAKFGSTCVPWMILIFFVGALVSLPQIANATGASVSSLSDVWALFDNNVGIKSGMSTGDFGIGHIICFAWANNLAWHMGLNDMGLFRFAKNYKYGYISAVGMFIGHFFAWTMAAFMGTTAASVLKITMAQLDPGLTTNTVLGATGLCAVVVAGWTTANPTIYRCALSVNSFLPKLSHKQSTYLVGILMTVLACFPMVQNIPYIALLLCWVTVAVGAMCVVEELLFPRIGYTKYWSMYKEQNINIPAIITWVVSILFVVTMLTTGLLDRYYIFMPAWIISAVLYTVLAGIFGAKGDYRKEEEEEAKFQKDLKELVDKKADEELENAGTEEKQNSLIKILKAVSYAVLAVLLLISVMNFTGNMELGVFKNLSFILTILYFIMNGTTTFISFRNQKVVIQ